MYQGIMTFKSEIMIPVVSKNELSIIFNRLLLDNPILFYVPSYSYCIEVNKGVIIRPNYQYDKNITLNYIMNVSQFLSKFDVLKQMNELEKEIHVHDYCQNRIKYDYSFNKHSHSVIGCIVHNSAVCEGIAKFVKIIFDYLGLKSLVVTGRLDNPDTRKMESHAWNIIEIHGHFYHLDVTLDVTMSNMQKRFDYFNLTDEDIKKDHTIENDVPPCMETKHNYFTSQALVMNNIYELEQFILHSVKRGKKNIHFKMSEKHENQIILEIAKRVYSSTTYNSFQVGIKGNEAQSVYEINFIH